MSIAEYVQAQTTFHARTPKRPTIASIRPEPIDPGEQRSRGPAQGKFEARCLLGRLHVRTKGAVEICENRSNVRNSRRRIGIGAHLHEQAVACLQMGKNGRRC